MSRTIHTKGQNNWQPRHMTQWQRERRDGSIQPMEAKTPWWKRIFK